MNHLRAYGGKAEARNFFRIVAGGDCGQVVEQESEARVGPVVEFADTGEGEQGKSPLIVRLKTAKGGHKVFDLAGRRGFAVFEVALYA